MRASRVPREYWGLFHTRKDYNEYPQASWEESAQRSTRLLTQPVVAPAPIPVPVPVPVPVAPAAAAAVHPPGRGGVPAAVAAAPVAAQEENYSQDSGLLHWDENDWMDFTEAVVAWCRVHVSAAARSLGLDRATTDRLLRDITGEHLRREIPF